MLTELNNKCVAATPDRNLIQCFHCTHICKVVPVRAMQAFRGMDVQLHTHTLNLSTTVNGHEWSASCEATHKPTEKESG